jgi:hypothetical protein
MENDYRYEPKPLPVQEQVHQLLSLIRSCKIDNSRYNRLISEFPDVEIYTRLSKINTTIINNAKEKILELEST